MSCEMKFKNAENSQTSKPEVLLQPKQSHALGVLCFMDAA